MKDPVACRHIGLHNLGVVRHDTALIVGGRAVPAYRETLLRLHVLLVEDLVELGLALDGLRRPAVSST